LSHENPASLVAGSTHISRNGHHVFINAVRISSPWAKDDTAWTMQTHTKEDDMYRSCLDDGRYFTNEESEWDLIYEYKEPVVHEVYLIVWSNGVKDARCTLRLAEQAARSYTHVLGRLTWKIFKLTGSEEIIDNESSK
jgi:hypothetical protein